MAVDRSGQGKCGLQVDLPGRTGEQIRAAYHAGDSLECVVDHDSELISGQSIAAFDDHIAAGGQIESLLTLKKIGESHGTVTDAKAASGGARSGLTVAAGARITGHVFRAGGCKFPASAAAVKDSPLSREPRDRLAIGLTPRALPEHIAVPFESEGVERAQHGVGAARDHARRVDIFDAYQPACAVGACIEVAADGRKQGAEM